MTNSNLEMVIDEMSRLIDAKRKAADKLPCGIALYRTQGEKRAYENMFQILNAIHGGNFNEAINMIENLIEG